ncbi:hypothetical protein [Marinobacterium aestuariivivens]|uniref:Uncharacterized protein n=1 Tax=Marinobacterium aestuariivivens TaxID=1698799 RepID=A0ABW1ZX37_9GAMM
MISRRRALFAGPGQGGFGEKAALLDIAANRRGAVAMTRPDTEQLQQRLQSQVERLCRGGGGQGQPGEPVQHECNRLLKRQAGAQGGILHALYPGRGAERRGCRAACGHRGNADLAAGIPGQADGGAGRDRPRHVERERPVADQDLDTVTLALPR